MSMFRIIWSVILAGLAACSFRNSWSQELNTFEPGNDAFSNTFCDSWNEAERYTHAAEEMRPDCAADDVVPSENGSLAFSPAKVWIWVKKFNYNPAAGKSTYILTSPLSLLFVFVAFPLTLLLKYSPQQSLIYTFNLLFMIMILFTVFSAVMLIFLSLLRDKISARACATMWLAPVLLLFQVWLMFDGQSVPLIQIYLPSFPMKILLLIWLIGFLLIFTVRFVSGQLFIREILKKSLPERDSHVLAVFAGMQEQLGYSIPEMQLLRCRSTETPFAMGGFIHPRGVVLPERDYSDRQLRMIFSHELHHLQRNDVETKLLLVFLTSLCWFNPLVWIATRKAVEDLELSCDEIVTAEMNEEMRKQYALLLLGSAGPSKGLTTCLSSAASVLRYRMKRIVTANSQTFDRKHKAGTVCIAFTVFLCCMSFGCIGITNQQGTFTELFVQPDSTVCAEGEDNASNPANSIHTISLSDVPALADQLNRIHLQKINSFGNYYSKDSEWDSPVSFWLTSDGETSSFCIYHDIIQVYVGGNKRADYYKVQEIDMDALEKAMEELP